MKRRTREAWRTLVAGYAGSGLTVTAYCQRERICTASFYRWRGIFGTTAMTVPDRPAVARSEPAFVDLGTLMRPGQRVEVRVEFGAGVVLQLSCG